jgi:hypothetical protein
MAQVPFMLADGPMQVYRARNPKKSPLWQCATHRAMVGEPEKPILPHPRSAKYVRARKKQILITP